MKMISAAKFRIFTVLLCFSPTLFAQAPISYNLDNDFILDEIVITAQKRKENQQNVPISLRAFEKDSLEMFGIDEIEDLSANIPNLFVNNFNVDATSIRVFIRGIGQNDVQLTQDPSVALYTDGVYVGTSIGAGFETIDLERIEILRGPQGTLYGRNATGGAINLISAKPKLDQLSLTQSLVLGTFEQVKSRSIINLPLGHSAALKLSYLNSQRDGVVENYGPGEDFGSEDRSNVRAAIRIQPSDALVVDYAYEDIRTQDSQRLEQVTKSDGSFSFLPTNILSVNDVSSNRLDAVTSLREIKANDVEITGHTLAIAYDVTDRFTLKSITAKRQLSSYNFGDGTATTEVDGGLYLLALGQPGPGISTGLGAPVQSRADVKFEQLSQELQILGNSDDDQWKYVAGLYFYKDESSRDANGSIALGLPRLEESTRAENQSFALYNQTTYSPDFSDNRLHFTLGARFSLDNRKAFRINNNAGSFAASAPSGASYDKDFTNFNPSFVTAYDYSDEVNIYAKVVSGYKSGGTSQRSASLTFFEEGFDEEELVSYELGLKGDFLENRLRTNLAVFYTEFDGFQTSLQTGPTPGDRDFIGIDDTTIEGLELDVTLLMIDNLKLYIGYGYQNSDLGLDSVNYFDSNDVAQTANLTGRLSYAAKHSAVAAIDYEVLFNVTSIIFHLGYNYQSSANSSVNVADNATIDPRYLLDATITIKDIQLDEKTSSLNISIWGKNLLDEEYQLINVSSFSFVDADQTTTFGDPRTYGITFTYKYQK